MKGEIMELWNEKKILILGMTYPQYSRKYTENVCTGGIIEDDFSMIRIHPVPRRYLDESKRFKAFQWIKAKITKHTSDSRPESFRIDSESIELEEIIPSQKPEERRRILDNSPHLFNSVEELRDKYDSKKTSMGIINPKEIIDIQLQYRTEEDRKIWMEKEAELLAQTKLPFEKPVMPIDFPEARFVVSWRCQDPRCQSHKMGIENWGLHELYRKYSNETDGKTRVLDKMRQELDLSKRDVYFFLGTLRGRQWQFGLMGTYSPKKMKQLSLL
jgi:hypothetical protein